MPDLAAGESGHAMWGEFWRRRGVESRVAEHLGVQSGRIGPSVSLPNKIRLIMAVIHTPNLEGFWCLYVKSIGA